MIQAEISTELVQKNGNPPLQMQHSLNATYLVTDTDKCSEGSCWDLDILLLCKVTLTDEGVRKRRHVKGMFL